MAEYSKNLLFAKGIDTMPTIQFRSAAINAPWTLFSRAFEWYNILNGGFRIRGKGGHHVYRII
jgi:hypothetical protein